MSLLVVSASAGTVNAMPATRLDAAEVARLEPLTGSPSPLGAAARAATLAARRHERAGRALARVQASIPLPCAVLPLLAAERWERGAIERLAASLATEGGEWLG